MIHLEENLTGPARKAASAVALASVLGLSGCGGGGAQSNSAAPALSFALFAADDGVRGIELWKTDGTATGTVLVKDINPAGSSFPGASGTPFPTELVFFNGAWFFSADDGVNGTELWKSDGTPGGTVRVKDINLTPGASSSPDRKSTRLNSSHLVISY